MTTRHVYLLRSPSGVVRYVGCTANVERRLAIHRAGGPAREWLQSLAARGQQPIVEVIATADSKTAYAIEAETIRLYWQTRRTRRHLLNGTLGRKRIPKSKQRRNLVRLYLTENEALDLTRAAREAGERPAEHARRVALESARGAAK